MTLAQIYRFSDWNPQFFREVKGRLKQRTLLLTVTASLTLQGVLLLGFWTMLPTNDNTSHQYCTGTDNSYYPTCLKLAGQVVVNWQKWGFDLFQAVSWLLPFVLLLSGVYMLIGDVGREEKRGTLNFIRLSPQSSQTILLGKLLGVPIVPYLVVALAIPLHLVMAIVGHVPLASVVSFYAVMLAGCAFFYTSALLSAFLGVFQGWVGAIAVWGFYSIFFQIWSFATNYGSPIWVIRYFGVPVNSLIPGLLLTLISFGVGTYWVWQAVNRRFRNPHATLLSKRQSYLATASFELWLLGFFIRGVNSTHTLEELTIVGMVNLVWFALLLVALTPDRQPLLDWTRYRHNRTAHSDPAFRNRSIVYDLLLGEKSPSLATLAVNGVIAIAVFTPWLATWRHDSALRGFVGLVLSITFMLICAAIVQLVLFAKTPRRLPIATAILVVLIGLPPIILGLLAASTFYSPLPWLFTAFAMPALAQASLSDAFAAFAVHLGVLTTLTLRLTRLLRKAGESESKALMAGTQPRA